MTDQQPTAPENAPAPDPVLMQMSDVANATASLTDALTNLTKVHQNQLNIMLESLRVAHALVESERAKNAELEKAVEALEKQLAAIAAQPREDVSLNAT